ncbi:MAG: insulinase family protein [Armatimonadota bacterium]|nr:MAG: insulinase family protein [Armatimonadota bacterium]
MTRQRARPGAGPFATAQTFLALVAVAGFAAVALAAPVEVFDGSTVHFSRLDNGLRVIVKEDHSAPVVAVNVVIRAGSRCETRDNNGVSHFIEHMSFRAARDGGGGRLGPTIEGLGGIANGGTLRDFTHYTTVTASQHLDVALNALAKALVRPQFDDAAVLDERLVLMREAIHLTDQPAAAAWDMAFKLAYGDHPYALPIGGTSASLLRVDKDALTAFYGQWYVPNNASVVIVGDVAPEKAAAAVARAFLGWQQGGEPAPPPAVPPLRKRLERVKPGEAPQATVLMGFHAPGIARPDDVCAADLLLTILGEGYTSRLTQALRQTHLADQVRVDFLTQELPGLFGVLATCAPERVDDVREAIEREVTRLSNELIGDEELANAQRRLAHSFVFSNETFEEQAATLGFYEVIASYEFACGYLDRVRSVTAAELQTAARAYLNPKRSVWVALVPQTGPGTGPGVVAARGAAE